MHSEPAPRPSLLEDRLKRRHGHSFEAACLAALVFAGCAAFSPQAVSKTKAVAVTGKDTLFVAPPSIADSAADSLLARIGWGEGRLSRELRKEMVYQFKQRGVPMTEDSARAGVILSVVLSEYAQGGGAASHFSVNGLLRTRDGERRIAFRKEPGKAPAAERDDPAMDNVRVIATSMVEGSRKDPKAKKAKIPEYNPGLILSF
jgi:hypothetical protein